MKRRCSVCRSLNHDRRDHRRPPRRNLDAYTDHRGVIRPIRGSVGYDEVIGATRRFQKYGTAGQPRRNPRRGTRRRNPQLTLFGGVVAKPNKRKRVRYKGYYIKPHAQGGYEISGLNNIFGMVTFSKMADAKKYVNGITAQRRML